MHDKIFKDLITNRALAILFLKQYLPKSLVRQVNWKSVKLQAANVEHTRQQHKKNEKHHEQSDLCFTFQFKDGRQGACFVHIEMQSTDDRTLLIRTRHYQTAYLLDFIKQNQGVARLPMIISIIYYANRKPFSHSLDLYDYFENPELARKYAFTTQFIDLSKLSDAALKQHQGLSGLELVFKHIAKRDIDKDQVLSQITAHIRDYDHFTIQTLIKYLAHYSDMQEKQFCDKIISLQPTLEGDLMTVAEQWANSRKAEFIKQGREEGIVQGIEQGREEGIEQGIERGIEKRNQDIVRNALQAGTDVALIARITSLSVQQIQAIRATLLDAH